jgi:hypothetical protein
MGADIHIAVERRTADGWQRVEPMVPPRWQYNGAPELERQSWYDGRNYFLFAILAGVRNGSGGDPVVPISDPRGLPDDVSDETRDEANEWGLDGHSHSHFTLAELFAHDWDEMFHRECWARRLRTLTPARTGETPDGYAERLQEAARVLRHLPDASSWGYETCSSSSEGQGASGWRTITWDQPQWESAGTEWWGLIARMVRVAPPEDIRIVFWFDN